MLNTLHSYKFAEDKEHTEIIEDAKTVNKDKIYFINQWKLEWLRSKIIINRLLYFSVSLKN